MIPDNAFASFAEREAQWAARLHAGRHVVMVAQAGTRAVGFGAAAQPAFEPDSEGLPYDAYLGQLYVLREFHRAGVGRALLSALVRELTAGGLRSLALHVLAANPARRYYEHLGATLVREEPATGDQFARCTYAWPDMRVLSADRNC